MPLFAKRPFKDSLLNLKATDSGAVEQNHIFEPEFHQDIYRLACETARSAPGAFQIGDLTQVSRAPNRGKQPEYIDDESDPSTLVFQGMMDHYGKITPDSSTTKICALKSVSVRWGYLDFGVARAVSNEYFEKHHEKCGVLQNDLLINSTGDGTIGRVAVYQKKHKAVVDGHVTIVRFRQPEVAWYAAAYLMSEQGQRQIYRYINGSSGQVEIYPQDIERLWIPLPEPEDIATVAQQFRGAILKHEQFESEMAAMLSLVK